MDKKQIIKRVIEDSLLEQNDDVLRKKVAYEVMIGLEENCIDFETVNTYTPSELVDKQQIQIAIDDEVFIITGTGIIEDGGFSK